MDEYTRDFVQESEENITRLNNSLLDLERSPDDREAMDEVFRMAHTLKGNCGAMGFDDASDLAHAIEDRLDDVRAGRLEVTPDLMDEIFDAVDRLETMIDDVRQHGAPRNDPAGTIERLHSLAPEEVLTPPADSEIETAIDAAASPEDDHDVYLVRLDVEPAESVNNGRRVVEALVDAFDLLGTVPDREAIDAGEYDGELDAVFGTAVTEEAISNALEPVDAVDDFAIVDVTDRFRDGPEPVESGDVDTGAGSTGVEAAPGGESADDMSVDELLDEFDDYDDLDEMVEHVEAAEGFDDLGDYGTFDGIEVELDVDAPDPLAETEGEGMETAADAAESAAAESPETGETGTGAADSTADEEDEEVVDDATETFRELQEEVDPVGFDELQDELEDLEFDQYDQEDEVGFDDLLSEEELADDEFDPFGDTLEEEAETAAEAEAAASEPSLDPAEATSEAQIENVDPEALIEEETAEPPSEPAPEPEATSEADVGDVDPDEPIEESGTGMDFETGGEAVAEEQSETADAAEATGDVAEPDALGGEDAFADDLFGGPAEEPEPEDEEAEPGAEPVEREPEPAEGEPEPEPVEREPEPAEGEPETEPAEGEPEPEPAEGEPEPEPADVETDDVADEPTGTAAESAPETPEPVEPVGEPSPEGPESVDEPESIEPEGEAEAEASAEVDEVIEEATAESGTGDVDAGPEASEAEAGEAEAGPAEVGIESEEAGAEVAAGDETAETDDLEAEADVEEEGPAAGEPAADAPASGSAESEPEPEPAEESEPVSASDTEPEGEEPPASAADFEPDFEIETGEEVAFEDDYEDFEDVTASGSVPESSTAETESEGPSVADAEPSTAPDVESDFVEVDDLSPDVDLGVGADLSTTASSEEPEAPAEADATSGPAATDDASEPAGPEDATETEPASETPGAAESTDVADVAEGTDAADGTGPSIEGAFPETVDADLDSVDFESVDATVEFGSDEPTDESAASEGLDDEPSEDLEEGDEELEDVEVSEFDLEEDAGAAAIDVDADDLAAEIEEADEAFADLDLDDSSAEPDFDGLDRDFGMGTTPGMRPGSDAGPAAGNEPENRFAGPDLPVEIASEPEELPDRDVDLDELLPTPPQEMGADGEEADETQSVRVDIDRVDDLLNLVEGLVTTRARLRRAVESGESLAAIDQEIDDLEDLVGDLQDTVMDVRLVPLSTVANRLPRTVRDIARDQNKEVAFEMEGADVEIDRSILDDLDDPLMHLVRNAVDHGIEPPEEREAADKDPEGTITLSARRRRDQVVIEVEDDGRGLDPDRLRKEAVEQGLLSSDEADDLPDEEIYDLVFEPGFSTTGDVTDVSGRGVGMDVVSTTVEELDGAVTIESEPGEGTSVKMTLPVSVAISDVLFVRSGEEEFGVPLKAVEEIGGMGRVEVVDGEECLVDGEESYPLVRLAERLETRGPTRDGDGKLVRLRKDVRQIAIHCDEVRGQQEVVVRPFEGVLGDIPGLSGATVLGEGDVVNILDVNTL